MSIESLPGGGLIATGPEGVALVRLLSLRGMLRLELRGMKRRGPSAFSIVKQEFKLRGNKQKVFEQFEQIIEEAGKKHATQ